MRPKTENSTSLADQQTSDYIHGVLTNIASKGVLFLGAPGAGKSTLALAMLKNGHQLVADDVVEIFLDETGSFHGRCPATIFGLLHSRDDGFHDVIQEYGEKSTVRQSKINFVVVIGDETGILRACKRVPLLARLWNSCHRVKFNEHQAADFRASMIESIVSQLPS